jgi:hypothetical protein
VDTAVNVDPAGDASALVVELFATDDQHWYVRVLGRGEPERHALTPATLIVRLWPVPNSDAIRGSVSLVGSEGWASFQCSELLVTLLRTWLARGSPGA